MCKYTIAAVFKGYQSKKYKIDANSAPEALYKIAKWMKKDNGKSDDVISLEIINTEI